MKRPDTPAARAARELLARLPDAVVIQEDGRVLRLDGTPAPAYRWPAKIYEGFDPERI